MVIYTKKGDDGKTTINNAPIDKNHLLLEALGNLDELNSSLGMLHAIRNKKVKRIILDLQNDLFEIGTDLAGFNKGFSYDEKTKELESHIDQLSASLPPLKNFIIPGGARHAARLQLSRSVTRRLERSLVALKKSAGKDKLTASEAIKYVNRLSDLLFVMARYVNFKLGIKEIIWSKRK